MAFGGMDHDLHTNRLRRAAQALEGLSCGDAFGERFFLPNAVAESMIRERAVPSPPWFFTDDTVMAVSVLETLALHQEINPDSLALSFAGRYDAERGYGPAMHKLLPAIRRHPQSWRTEAAALFHGEGSFGNGSAMRVAPLGAYFADHPERIAEQARLSSIPTHSHPEAVAGAVAVAVATGLAWQMRNSAEPPDSQAFLEHVHQRLPGSHVRRASGMRWSYRPKHPLKLLLGSWETARL